CMGERDLEFVWVGDDAIDPLQQAQTLQILVSAGIKTREEARAELGLGGEGKAGREAGPQGLGKFNPYHDERGRFTTADDAVDPGGVAGSSSKPSGPLTAGLDNIATDAIVDGGTANQAGITQTAPKPVGAEDNAAPIAQSTTQTARTQGLTVVHDVPQDAVSFTAGDGTFFYAPPNADFPAVYADGQAHWQNFIAAILALRQFGTYDFQRSDGKIYLAYANASNYAVGVYMAGAGYSYDATIKICSFIADLISSNAAANTQAPGGRGAGMMRQTVRDPCHALHSQNQAAQWTGSGNHVVGYLSYCWQ
ncbi:MAG: hypothetical protein JO288_21455, partial [Hyphomicrobiales bacterium]|nr:hypothetical protein [Hyphomicrobiales bacterium]